MKRYYANLLGKWVDITDDGTVEDGKSPKSYFGGTITYSEESEIADCFKHDYINVQYGGKNYRIHPSCIQIVTQEKTDDFTVQVL